MGWLTRKREPRTVIEPQGVRDPRGGTSQMSYHLPGSKMPPAWDATLAVDRGYEASVAVYRCVNAIAEAVVSAPFRAGADPDNPKSFNPSSPLAQMLGPMTGRRGLGGRSAGTVNASTSARALWQWSVAQWLVTGRFGWEIDTDGADRPVALWPLPARLLTPVPSGKGAEQYFSRFMYGMPVEEVTFRPDEIVYGWRPSQGDWRQPESPLAAARLPISTVVTQGQYDFAFLANGGVPAHVVVHPRIDDDDRREAWRRQFTSEHAGAANAGRTAFTEYDSYGNQGASDALSILTIGQSAKDQQATDRYRQYSDEIYIALGTPRSIAGDASGRTFDNASQEYLTWHENTVEPLCRTLAEAINTQLASRLGNAVGWFDFSAVHGRRKRFTVQEGVQLLGAGVVTKSELRAEVGLSEELPEELEEAALEPVPPALEQPETPVEPAPVALEVVRAREAPDPGVRRAKLWDEADRRMRAHEVLFARSMGRLFDRQEQAVIRSLNGKRGRQALRAPEDADAAALFDTVYWTEQTEEEAAELYRAVFATAGTRAGEALGVDVDLTAPYVDQFVRSRANALAGPVVETTYEAIKGELAEGSRLGEPVEELATRVRSVFADASRVRSERIARTEVVGAFNGSAWTVAQELDPDLAAGQEWIATRDKRTREQHAAADGQTVDIRTTFTVGGSSLRYPGDPNGPAGEIVNCRCTLAFLTPEEMAERGRPVPFTRARDLISLVARRQLAAADIERMSA